MLTSTVIFPVKVAFRLDTVRCRAILATKFSSPLISAILPWNNELSGPLVLLGLFERIRGWPRRRFTYRFLLNPETIGALSFLHRYADQLRETLISGIVLTCLGGPAQRLT